MKLCFSGFEGSIELEEGFAVTLEIHNRVLFSRVCQSLQSGAGQEAIEPYSFWGGDEEQRPGGQLLFVASPLTLPWDDREFVNGISKRMEELVFEDECIRRELEELSLSINSAIAQVALQLHSDYGFTIDWELKRYLKLLGFGIDGAPDESLFDKVIRFLQLAEDVRLSRTITLVSFKLFFSENEIAQILEQAVFSGLSVLLLENAPNQVSHRYERKYIIDQDFLEYWSDKQSDMSVS